MTTKSNTNGASEGTIRIIHAHGVQEQPAEHLDGEITIDLATDEVPRISTEFGSEERPEVVVEESEQGTNGGAEGLDDRDGRGTVGDHDSFSWLPLLGSLNFLAAVLSAILMGPQIWSLGASPLGELAVRTGHIWMFGISLAGTLWMWNDATARQDRDGDWQPRVTLYITGGAACLTAFGGAFFVMQGVPLEQLAGAAAGLFILGLPTSSIFAGPVYLYNYARHGGGAELQAAQ